MLKLILGEVGMFLIMNFLKYIFKEKNSKGENFGKKYQKIMKTVKYNTDFHAYIEKSKLKLLFLKNLMYCLTAG